MTNFTTPFKGKGYAFFDNASGRTMMLVYEGEWKDWICYKHPDGQWVSLRKAATDDWRALVKAMSKVIDGTDFGE